MFRFLKTNEFWVIVAFSFFCATIPLTGWISLVSAMLGHLCMVAAYAIAQNQHYETFYEFYKGFKVKWKTGISRKWNIKRLLIVAIAIFIISVVLALIASRMLWIAIFLSLAIVDIWMLMCLLSYRLVDYCLLKKYEKKYGKIGE